MTREVYNNAEFAKFSRNQIFVRVFQDSQEQGARLAKKYQIPGFPTLIILDSNGKEIDRIIGFREARDLMEELTDVFEAGESISI